MGESPGEPRARPRAFTLAQMGEFPCLQGLDFSSVPVVCTPSTVRMTSWLRRNSRRWLSREWGTTLPRRLRIVRWSVALANDGLGQEHFRQLVYVGGTSGFSSADAICLCGSVPDGSEGLRARSVPCLKFLVSSPSRAGLADRPHLRARAPP